MKKEIFILILIFFIPLTLKAGATAPYLFGHATTCTGLINMYPADSVNWFFRTQHSVVQYYVYMLFPQNSGEVKSPRDRNYLFLNTYKLYSGAGISGSEDSNVFENVWISPSGKVICRKVVSWQKSGSDKKISVDGKSYIPYIFSNYIGIREENKENGQEKLPDEKGLYHINLYLNGRLVSITFFEMKD